jgi:hypothetical protein
VDYICIRAWGAHMGSFPYYIRDQITIAHEDKAPGNAIYKRDDGTWATIDDITDKSLRDQIDRRAARIQENSNPTTRRIM